LQYVVYLFFYNIVKENLMDSKRKLKTRNKKTRKFQRERTIGKK